MDPAASVKRLLFCALFLGHFSGLCRAHREEFPKRDALFLKPDRVTIIVSYIVPGPDEASVVRRLFDRDHSGTLEKAERAALLTYICGQATAFLRVELDGKTLALKQQSAELEERSLLARITLSAQQNFAAGSHHLRLFDRHKDRRITVPLRVSAEGLRVDSALPPLPMLDDTHPIDLALSASR